MKPLIAAKSIIHPVPQPSLHLPRFLTVVAVLTGSLVEPCVSSDQDPPNAYITWRQQQFQAACNNPALEASIWGERADPDSDGCPNLMEFVMHRNPKQSDPELGMQCRLDAGDLVATYRETTLTSHGVTWRGQWSVDLRFWVVEGVRYQTIETHASYRLVEARISRNLERRMSFRLAADR